MTAKGVQIVCQIIQPFSILMQEGESMCRSLGPRRVEAAYLGRDGRPKG